MKNWRRGAASLLLSFFISLPLIAAGEAAEATAIENMEVRSLPEWPVTVAAGGPTLLFSDSPEAVSADGILYQDTVQGAVRLFYHHVNDTRHWKRLAIVVENPGPGAATLQILRAGQAGPDGDYLAVGKEVQAQYFRGEGQRKVTVPGGGAVDILSGDNGVSFQHNELLHGMLDFKVDKAVRVKFVFFPAAAQAVEFAAWAPVLPADQYRLRGTFAQADRIVTASQEYRPLQSDTIALTLADNGLDRYARGIDATDGSATENYGNYGIVYDLRLPTAGSGSLAVYLSPQGGDYAGALDVRYQREERIVPTPLGQTAFGAVGDARQAALVGRYRSGKELFVRFSPPGASNLPVRLVIAPFWRFGSEND